MHPSLPHPPTSQGPGSQQPAPRAEHEFSRRTFIEATAAAATTATLGSGLIQPAASAHAAMPTGPGSAAGAPHLSAAFRRTFESRYIHTGQLRLHAVTGGEGPPLLLVHGWPQTWYAWRRLMPALARDFQVIAVDQRGMGLSDKPRHGYDTGTLADDLVALMHKLGHRRFAMVGADTGMLIGYALAADHPHRLTRLAVAEAIIPGVTPTPPLFGSDQLNDRLWHFAFNRLDTVNEQLVRGREDIYFGWQLTTKAEKKLPDYAVRYYTHMIASVPGALRGSFGLYRALDASIAQNQKRIARRVILPVLAIGGANSVGEGVANTMRLVADHVQSVVIPGCGHYVAEETPKRELVALAEFLAPYRR
jgi:pimeloyl-ACP methyl ester carboxylesterase